MTSSHTQCLHRIKHATTITKIIKHIQTNTTRRMHKHSLTAAFAYLCGNVLDISVLHTDYTGIGICNYVVKTIRIQTSNTLSQSLSRLRRAAPNLSWRQPSPFQSQSNMRSNIASSNDYNSHFTISFYLLHAALSNANRYKSRHCFAKTTGILPIFKKDLLFLPTERKWP
jgi:hypothetical protein